jgi:hypothetical protein
MKDKIRILTNESLISIKNREVNLVNELKELYNNSKINTMGDNFINESIDLLLYDNYQKYVNHLFESIEDDMMAALSDICVLTFSSSNTKLGTSAATFSLPAGWTCPYADTCLKYVERDRKMDPEKVGTFTISKKTGKKVPYKGDVIVHKGKDATHDCYAANQEMQYDAVRANRWHNYDLLDEVGKKGGYKAQAQLIVDSLNHFFDYDGFKEIVRIHESGDFYNGEYLKAWLEVAKMMPKNKFYAYTKSIPLIKKYMNQIDNLDNFILTLSKGGKRDRDLGGVDVKEAIVFDTPEEVLKAGLLVDLDDTLAQEKGGKDKNFALLLHGTQAKGEKSQNKIRNETFMAYWKYRKLLNSVFKLDPSHIWTTEEAQSGLNVINKIIEKIEQDKKDKKDRKFKKFNKSDLKFKAKLLRYVIKYNNYKFNDNLINILPEKYRP